MKIFRKDWWKSYYRQKPYQTHVATLGHVEKAFSVAEIDSDQVVFADKQTLTEKIKQMPTPSSSSGVKYFDPDLYSPTGDTFYDTTDGKRYPVRSIEVTKPIETEIPDLTSIVKIILCCDNLYNPDGTYLGACVCKVAFIGDIPIE